MTLREWQITERARRKQYLDRLQSGNATTQARRASHSPLVDTTGRTIETERAAIAELDALIAETNSV